MPSISVRARSKSSRLIDAFTLSACSHSSVAPQRSSASAA